MSGNQWSWAKLNGEQIDHLKEAERTLGARLLLAYQSDAQAKIQGEQFSKSGMHVAALNESQVECLVGLEQKIGSVVIAYQ
ncbi:MAG TPA: hypothetical protein VGJ97_12040 [Anaerolineaceae bacterium]